MAELIIGNGEDIRELVESMFRTREQRETDGTPDEREEDDIVLL